MGTFISLLTIKRRPVKKLCERLPFIIMTEPNNRYTKVLLLLFLTIIHCNAKPLQPENSTSQDEANTTPCPEELAQKLVEGANKVSITKNPTTDNIIPENEDNTTPPCPEELEKRKSEESNIQINENDSGRLEENGESAIADETTTNYNAQEETTICPEELKKIGNADATDELQANVNEISGNSQQERSEISNHNKDETPKNSEKPSENPLENNELKISEPNVNLVPPEKPAEEPTTICPEELLKEQNKLEAINNENIEFAVTTPVKSDDANLNDNLSPSSETIISEDIDAPTTLCPEEEAAAKRQEEISAKTLLVIQKNSALFKLVKDKFESGSSVAAKEEQITRSKRQSYSPYYSSADQPITSYNSQGLATASDDTSTRLNNQIQNNNHQSISGSHYSNKASPNVQRVPAVVAYNNVRPSQQIQWQYQKNQVKPNGTKRGYQINPYTRYRANANGNFKNYYNLKSTAVNTNRRQFQANAARQRGTSVRATRAPIKKKFRPSPVFV